MTVNSNKKILILTTISKTVNAFLIPHLEELIENGYSVEVACHNSAFIKKELIMKGVVLHELSMSRFPFSLRNLRGYLQLKRILKSEYYIIHTHTPIISAMVRIIAKSYKLTNIYYTAHGFHFYKGAPLINWLLYYPIEKFLSRYTYKLITINREDYKLAISKFKAKEILYIPGIGIKIERFKYTSQSSKDELNKYENAFNIFSVGEINRNKNHIVILKALKKVDDNRVHYYIVGEGKNKKRLQKFIMKSGLSNNVHFLGFRDDVPSLLRQADAFAFPSKREGLGLAAIEALISDVPLITSNIHGINDYAIDNQTALKCNPNDVKCFATNIKSLMNDESMRNKVKEWCEHNIHQYDIKNIIKLMNQIYNNN